MTGRDSSPPPTVRPITAEEHAAFLQSLSSASYLQLPSWAKVKPEWRAESLGWFRDGDLVGVGLVLHRQLPKLKRSLAYFPEGPVIDWNAGDLTDWLAPMTAYLKSSGAFAIRICPPVIVRRWEAATVKAGISDEGVQRLADLAPDEDHETGHRVMETLAEAGWRKQNSEEGFAAGQPAYRYVVPLKGRTSEEVLAGFNQLWRRNIKKADKAGVVVTQGTAADLPAYHALYAETAARDDFIPRPLSYFQTMYAALEDEADFRLYLAHHEGDLVASTIWIRVGTHAWYAYGASSTAKREVRGSNAIQWRMISDSIEAGAEVYDLRGITDTLDPDDPHVGLIQFKVGTGGEAVEYVDEWDLPINRVLYKAFELYLRRR